VASQSDDETNQGGGEGAREGGRRRTPLPHQPSPQSGTERWQPSTPFERGEHITPVDGVSPCARRRAQCGASVVVSSASIPFE